MARGAGGAFDADGHLCHRSGGEDDARLGEVVDDEGGGRRHACRFVTGLTRRTRPFRARFTGLAARAYLAA
jgi:hypothetical protein